MKRRLQTSWYETWGEKESGETRHGGDLAQGKRKTIRPLDTKRSLHLVLKSSKAKGQLNLLTTKNRYLIIEILKKQSLRFGVRICRFANVGNHLHLMLRFSSRRAFQNFLRTITTLIARKVTGAVKGKAFGRFWDALSFTRVVISNYAEYILRDYIKANVMEAGFGRDFRERFLIDNSRQRKNLFRGNEASEQQLKETM